jgi:hypothetical protein
MRWEHQQQLTGAWIVNVGREEFDTFGPFDVSLRIELVPLDFELPTSPSEVFPGGGCD